MRPRLILASASPRRVALLAQLGVVPDAIEPADIDETPRPAERPRDLAVRLAASKAQAVADRFRTDAVLGADTVVAAGRRLLPKADDEAQARRCLALLANRRHRVITAVTLATPAGTRARWSETLVSFGPLTPTAIDAYVATGEWRGKAGGYAVQGRAAAFVRALSGSYSGVVGLPLFETAALLRWAGVIA